MSVYCYQAINEVQFTARPCHKPHWSSSFVHSLMMDLTEWKPRTIIPELLLAAFNAGIRQDRIDHIAAHFHLLLKLSDQR